ncbi:unnamed protein product [Penicillium palitans]
MASTKDSSLFCETVGGLLMEDRFSDMTIVCQEVAFKAHRAIIYTQSSFFDAALEHGFKVICSMSNSQTYNDQYGKPKSNPPGNSKNPTNEPEHRKTTAYSNFSVYLAADKFGIFPLKELALTKLSAWIRDSYRTPSFPKIVLEIMTSMPHDSILLGLLSGVISDHLYTLGSNNEILELLKDHGQLGSLII